MVIYCFDGSMTGLLSCVFRAFQFQDFQATITSDVHAQNGLFDDFVQVSSNDEHAQRVWQGLKKKTSGQSQRNFYSTFLSENQSAYQHLFNYCLYVFQHSDKVDENYGQPDVLALAQWAKQVGREKHRMEAFVRFKKCQNDLFLSLVRPDFNVLPLIERHFKARYQDQKWLIYDEKRKYGIYYDLHKIHQIEMNATEVDTKLASGFSQSFTVKLDEQELLYDQLWKDYFRSVNIEARQNMKLHIQYVPKRYWRYMNEKSI